MIRVTHIVLGLLAAAVAWPLPSQADSDLSASSRWAPPTKERLSQELHQWARTSSTLIEDKATLMELWTRADSQSQTLAELLDRSLAIVAPQAWKSIRQLQQTRDYQGPLQFESGNADAWPPRFLIDHARFTYGKRLAEQGLYDEALQELEKPLPSSVIDPAALLFFEASCQHYLLQKEDCIATLKQLLARSEGLPVRYLSVSQMMLKDIEPLEEDSLDEIARLMRDIERRLDLGRAGKKVRQTEEDVIAKLDKMIDDLEKQRQQQQQQQQQQSQQSQQNDPSSQPLEQQAPGAVRGPGDVDPKFAEHNGDWGDVPPKEREEALQQISNEYPSHYRRAIEEYFRKIARQRSPDGN